MKTRWRRAGTAAEVICVAGVCVGGVLAGQLTGSDLVALVVAIIAALVGVGCDLRAAECRDPECDK